MAKEVLVSVLLFFDIDCQYIYIYIYILLKQLCGIFDANMKIDSNFINRYTIAKKRINLLNIQWGKNSLFGILSSLIFFHTERTLRVWLQSYRLNININRWIESFPGEGCTSSSILWLKRWLIKHRQSLLDSSVCLGECCLVSVLWAMFQWNTGQQISYCLSV